MPGGRYPGQAKYLIGTAARAPSVHYSQPWRFRVGEYVIELYADPGRKLRVDPVGREVLISRGAALFGLQLAVRSLGYQPIVDLLPDRVAVAMVHRTGLTVSPDHISFEDVIRDADVSRARSTAAGPTRTCSSATWSRN
jgi:hypothetical protein